MFKILVQYSRKSAAIDDVITIEKLTLAPLSWPMSTNKENPNAINLIRKLMVLNITDVETIVPL